MKKQKSGISLIVLVITIIVIIILAVAVILSIANNNPIENAKEARFKSDVKAIQEELQLLKSSNYAKNNGTSYDNPDGTKITVEQLQSASKYKNDFKVKDGQLEYMSGKFTDEEKSLLDTLGVAEEKVAITFARKESGDLAVGNEVVASNGESFYVIGFSEDNTKVNLLAKSNLNKDGTSQGTSEACEFSSEFYWSEATAEELADLSKLEVPQGVTSIIATAKKYGESLGGIGRLMTLDEVKSLGDVVEHGYYTYSTSSCKSFVNSENYWLGSGSNTSGSIWILIGSDEAIDGCQFDYNLFSCGIRPVIEVLASSID